MNYNARKKSLNTEIDLYDFMSRPDTRQSKLKCKQKQNKKQTKKNKKGKAS